MTDEDKDGCELWTGATQSAGYGVVMYEGKHWLAHRRAWVEAGRHLVPGMDLHHICENRLCVNVAHLEQITRGEHLRRHPREHRKFVCDKCGGERKARAPSGGGFRATYCPVCQNARKRELRAQRKVAA